jgi:O-antigen/teichoic acid export membrane protein
MFDPNLRRRFWFELGAAISAAAMLLLTLVSHEWVEVLFGVAPDGGNGAAEVLIPVVLFAAAAASALMASREWLRTASAA